MSQRYNTINSTDAEGASAPLLDDVHVHAAQYEMSPKSLRVMHGINTAVGALFTLTLSILLFYMVGSCNNLINSFLVVSTIITTWTTVRGLVRIITKTVCHDGHYFAFGSCFIKVLVMGTFTLVSFMDGKHCDHEILTAARVVSSLLFVWSLFMYDLNEHASATVCV
jgi:hypothetical protein